MIVVAGEALIDLLVAPDGRLAAAAGGGPFNTARTIARLGGEVAFLGRLSTDRFGAGLRSALATDGVDLRWAPDTDDPTTLAVAEVDDRGVASYRFHLRDTSAPGLEAATVAAAFGATPRAVHLGTLGLAVEPIASVLADALPGLPRQTLVMVDVNARPAVIKDRAAYLARLDCIIARADIVKVSADDLSYLAPGDPPHAAARAIRDRSGSVVLVTDGVHPVAILVGEESRTVPVPPVEVVDTIGAGDAFGGGFLARWVEAGRDHAVLADVDAVVDATLVGIEVAGLTCRRSGAEPPHRREVTRLAG